MTSANRCASCTQMSSWMYSKNYFRAEYQKELQTPRQCPGSMLRCDHYQAPGLLASKFVVQKSMPLCPALFLELKFIYYHHHHHHPHMELARRKQRIAFTSSSGLHAPYPLLAPHVLCHSSCFAPALHGPYAISQVKLVISTQIQSPPF